jgi:hypothetical protein
MMVMFAVTDNDHYNNESSDKCSSVNSLERLSTAHNSTCLLQVDTEGY